MTQLPMGRPVRVVTGLVAAASGGAGAAAVFLTGNELGSAALLVVGMYFGVAALLGRFPRLALAGSEIDPGEVAQARRAAAAAKLDSEEAKEGLQDTRVRLEAVEAALAPEERSAVRVPSPGDRPDGRLLALAREYDEERWTSPSSEERTVRMTGIIDRMIAVCGEIEVPDVEALLASDDPGLRLVGVAYLNARPGPIGVASLVRVATADRPFDEYWALVTLRKVLRDHCDRLGADLRQTLRARLHDLPPGSDRAREIQAILLDCP